MPRKKLVREVPQDTNPAVERMQVASWRRMSSAEKASTIDQASMAVLTLARAGIRNRYPGADDREQRIRLAYIVLGRELAARYYPKQPKPD